MKNYISKFLIVLGTLTFSFVFVNSASAALTIEKCMNPGWTTPVGCDALLDSYYAGRYNPGGYDYSYSNNQYAYNNPNQYSNGYSNSQSGTPIINNYYYQTNPTTNKTTTSSTVKSTTASSTSAKSNTSDTSKTNTKVEDTSKDSQDVFTTDGGSTNGLTALSSRGSDSFLPSSFWQWLLVIILILIIVIIARKIARSSHDNIHAAPAH